MMTLVPALAFGGNVVASELYNRDASEVYTDDLSVKVTTDKKTRYAKVYVEFKDDKNNILANSPIDMLWLKSSMTTVKVDVDKKYLAKSEATEGITKSFTTGVVGFKGGEEGEEGANQLKADGNGEVEFKFYSSLAGTAKLSFWSADPAEDGVDKDSIYFIDEVEIKFTADDGKVDEVTLDVDGGDEQVGKEITLTARVLDESNNSISNEPVTFYKKKDDAGSWVNIGTKETDRRGTAKLKYYEEAAGEYQYRLRVSGKNYDFAGDKYKLEVNPGAPAKIEAVTADGKVFEVDKSVKVKFVVKDHYGNKIPGADIEVVLLSVPSGSDLKTDEVGEFRPQSTEDKEIEAEITFDKVGDYKIRANPKDLGIFTTLTVSAKEVGDIEELVVKFEKDEKKSLIAGGIAGDEQDSLKLKVKCIDVNGIEVDVEDFRAFSSNVSLVEVEVDGDKLEVKGPKDDKKRGVAKITVVDLDSSKTASIDVPVVGQPYAIDADYVVSGKTAKATLQFVDDEGAVTRAGDDKDYELLLPKGVVISEKKVFDEKTGEATFTATVEEYGEYDVTVVSEQGIAKKFTLVVGVPESEKEIIGAKSVTMFIGSSGYVQDGVAKITDVAPFIKDDRTFVAIRPIADAFGCEIGWDEIEQKVTLVRDDIVVTIIIGSSDIEVVEDGVVSVVEADVAAFIEDGRTVLPFRAVGNAFGATVDYDEVTQSVTYTQS